MWRVNYECTRCGDKDHVDIDGVDERVDVPECCGDPMVTTGVEHFDEKKMSSNGKKPINATQMTDLIRETFDEIVRLRSDKGQEYAEDCDALSNFRRDAADLNMTMESVWRVFAGKHWNSICTYVRDVQCGTKRRRTEPIEGRVDDLITYLCLFKAMIREREGKR